MLKGTQMIYRGHRFFTTATVSLAALGLVLLFGQTAGAQETAPPPEERVPLTAEELEELVGPIALYPDDLVSIVLPASTYPLQIVQAARYLEAHETNDALEPDENWDDSVVALLNYPEVIALLNEDLDRTWALGEAALYQQAELLDAIQAFRDRAYAAGNLETDERQVVTKDAETIVIKPADPEVIYVPYYEPRHVVVHQPYPVYHYYPHAYPVYYYPYSYGHSFGSGFFWGVTTAFSIGWHSHYLNVHNYRHYAHPYYGHYYHYPWYRRHSISASYGGHIWRPGYYSGARQQHTATVTRTNRDLGATSRSRGRLRNQPAVNTPQPQRSRLRNQPTTGTQPTAGTRRGNPRTAAGTRAGGRTGTVTQDAVNRARTASRSNGRANPRPGSVTRTRNQPGTTAPTTVNRQNPGQRLGGVRNQPGSTRATPSRNAATERARSAAASRTVVRNQPRTLGSQPPRTFGGVSSRQRTQSTAAQGSRAPRSTAARPGTVQRRSFGAAPSRSAPPARSYGGRVNRSASSPQPSSGGYSGSANRSSARPAPRAGGAGRTRNQR